MVPTRLKSLAVASGAVILPAVVMAAPPTAFDQYTINADGTINYAAGTGGCPTGFTCSATPISEAGFYQVQLTDNTTGEAFFHTIIAEESGAGADPSSTFASENFVVQGVTAGGGIAGKQSLTETGTSSGYISINMTQATGSFNTGEPLTTMSQTVANVDPAVATPDFQATFDLSQNDVGGNKVNDITLGQSLSGTDAVTGATDFTSSFNLAQTQTVGAAGPDSKTIDITSGVLLNDTGTTNDQTFQYKYSAGAATVAGSASLPDGQTVNWVDGDAIDTVLIGQTVTGAGDFGFERLADLSDNSATNPADAPATELATWSSLTSLPPATAPF